MPRFDREPFALSECFDLESLRPHGKLSFIL